MTDTNTELLASDLETYTQGRLAADDTNTTMVLEAAVTMLRNFCRWNVNPTQTETDTLDGPGHYGGLKVGLGGLFYPSGTYLTGMLRTSRVGADTLFLPTKRLQDIVSVVEDGVTLDVSDLQWSETGAVIKSNHEPWTANFRGITVTYTHGYSDQEAMDWRRLALAMADRMSMVRGLVGPFTTTMGPYRVNAYFGESRTGTLPMTAGWLDDLTAQVDTRKYIRVDI